MSSETTEADENGRGYFERGILRNRKRFSAVFERIYLKYNREFESDEPGGSELTSGDLLDLREEEEGKRYRRGKQLSSYHLLDNVSSESEDDSELTALLHQKVILVKKEISWDEEEQRDRERSRLKMAVRHCDTATSSSSSESEGSEGERPRRSRRRRVGSGWREKESCVTGGGDGSETLYETEYLSEHDPAHVQSDPEENGCLTPPRCLVDREAYSTPRVTHRCRRRSSLIRGSVIRELGKRLSAPIDNPVDPNPDDGIVSGYDTASGYQSGPGEHIARRNSSESDTLEYVGTPEFSPSPTQDILCAPPPVSPSLFDEDITISLKYNKEEQLQDTDKGDENSKGVCCNSQSEVEENGRRDTGCTCDGKQEKTFVNGRGVPLSAERSHDESCDNSSVVNNVYTNITYISYGCGHTVSTNRPSCFQCFSGQYYDSCCPYLHPQYHYSHPPHYHTAPPSQHEPPCKPEPTFNQSVSVGNLVDPQFDLSIPNNKLVTPTLTKRKLDSELCDPSGNGAAPLAKKHCH